MKLRYEKSMNSRVFKEPYQIINEKYIEIDKNVKRIQSSIQNIYKDKKMNCIELIAKLDALSPLKTLTRGYIIAEKEGKMVKSIQDIEKDDEISLRFSDGQAKAKIIGGNIYE